MKLNTAVYESELQVRPDDIDMFQHVHNAKYLDYVLAARYDQMSRCYGNPMSTYLEKGLGWVVKSCTINFKRPLRLGDTMIVQTNLAALESKEVSVNFAILNKGSGKLCADGHFDYALIEIASGRAQTIPDWVIEHYILKEPQ